MNQVVEWRTSERSNTQGGECVEVAVFEDERSV
ncbi:DUF397 domain-containing protein [Actinoallomurus sp. CA-150999]